MASLRAVAALEVMRVMRRPFAWFVLALGVLAMALFYLLFVVRYLEQAQALAAQGVTSEVVVRYFGAAALMSLLLTPLLTMHTCVAERRDGMLAFFFTQPLTTSAILGGKLCGVLVLLGAFWLALGLMPITLVWGAELDFGVYATNLLGLALFMLAHASLGLMCSALMRQPVAAGVLALSLSLALWFADWAQRLDAHASLFGGISSVARLRGFALGLVMSADVAYFLLATCVCLALAHWALEGQRRYA